MKKSCFVLLFVAMFALVACNTPNTTGNNGVNKNGKDQSENEPQKSEQEVIIDNLITQCQDFDAETLIQSLPGLWKTDTFVYYDEEWQTITNWCMVMGEYNHDMAGWSSTKYEFNSDGTGLYHYTTCDPTIDCTPLTFAWRYDAESKKLVLSGEYSVEFDVKGYNGEYIILDHIREVYDAHADYRIYYYTREIYKRKTE